MKSLASLVGCWPRSRPTLRPRIARKRLRKLNCAPRSDSAKAPQARRNPGRFIREVFLMSLVGSVGLLVLATVVSGQQKVPFQGGIPLAPDGLAHRPLPKLPMEFDTGEGQRIRVVAVARG